MAAFGAAGTSSRRSASALERYSAAAPTPTASPPQARRASPALSRSSALILNAPCACLAVRQSPNSTAPSSPAIGARPLSRQAHRVIQRRNVLRTSAAFESGARGIYGCFQLTWRAVVVSSGHSTRLSVPVLLKGHSDSGALPLPASCCVFIVC